MVPPPQYQVPPQKIPAPPPPKPSAPPPPKPLASPKEPYPSGTTQSSNPSCPAQGRRAEISRSPATTKPSITRKDRRSPTGSTTPTLVITYAAKHLDTIQLDTSSINTPKQEHVTVRCRTSHGHYVVICNVYWLPHASTPAPTWIESYTSQHKQAITVLIAGDFNCPNSLWGYQHTTTQGHKLEHTMQAQRLSLITDTTDPTRQGNCVQQDTSPDLVWHYRPSSASGDNLRDNLGSDHFIIQISLPLLYRQTTHGLTPALPWPNGTTLGPN
ncbi:uncharacterized protein ISCGN_014146 [Ixodes scapularis]